jgi:hypothetical protein
MDVEGSAVALLAAAALHLGFQLTVTFVVYPALASATDWEQAHPAHTRSITPVVVLVYAVLVMASAWALVSFWPDPWVLVSVAGAAVALLSTALVAGPTHGRLAEDRHPMLLGRLLIADRVRTAGAAVCLVGAAVSVFA